MNTTNELNLQMIDTVETNLNNRLESLNVTLMIIIVVMSIILLIIIYFIYVNNSKLQNINEFTTNLNELTNVSKDNDDYILEMNSKIVSYLREKDHMFKKIDQLNTQLSVNADKNISQDTILKEIKVTQKSHETDLEQMKNMYHLW